MRSTSKRLGEARKKAPNHLAFFSRTGRPFVPALVLACFLLGLPQFVSPATPRTFVAEVDRVSDGDSLVASVGNSTKLRIRLLGIDAPEIARGRKPGQPFGKEAREFLGHLIGGKTVRVEVYGLDRYRRLLAVIWQERVNVNLLMVATGYAEVYRGTACRVYCWNLEQAEAKAKRYQVGMWIQGGKYESPTEFRRRMRSRGG